MATQLKPSDFTYAAQTPRPNISVVFNAGPAALAVREKADQLSADIRDATLDEITQPSDLPIRLLLAERNAVIQRLNEDLTLTDEQTSVVCGRVNQIDTAIIKRSADTPDDAVMKLLTLVQITAEGHEVEDTEAAQAITEARKHFGIGFVHGQPDEIERAGAVLPATYDPYMRGPYLRWQRAYDAYIADRATRIAFETGALAEALKQDEVVRASYPADHDLRADPVAAAALDAVGYYQLEQHFNELVWAEYDTLERLLRVPAPSANELAIKLKLFEAVEGWAYENAGDVVPVLVSDARRFGGQGAYPQADQKLTSSFARLKQMMDEGAVAHPDGEQAYFAERDEVEMAFWKRRASTLEGVIARLRVAFSVMAKLDHADHAITDPNSVQFRHDIALGDMYEQVAWSAIEDLARIAGVNLVEQSA